MLGPLELDGTTSTLGLRDRVVLEALAVRPGTVVRAESLAEAIWGETPPPSWPKVVQGCVSRLRKTLGGDVIETAEHGYRLRVHVDHVDHLRFERLIGRARELLTLGEPERAAYLLREALDLWRGEPFTELNGWAPGRIELERLVELHRDAEELHVEALLRSGRHRGRARPCRAPRPGGAVPRAAVGAAGAGAVPGRAASARRSTPCTGPARSWSTSWAWTRAPT